MGFGEDIAQAVGDLDGYAGEPVTYIRDGTPQAWKAWRGSSVFDYVDDYGNAVTYKSQDFMGLLAHPNEAGERWLACRSQLLRP